jgi:hypothetical protein
MTKWMRRIKDGMWSDKLLKEKMVINLDKQRSKVYK